MTKKLKVKINMTPTWLAMYPLYCEWIDTGTKDQKALLKDELKRLCEAMDELKEFVKTKEGGTK